MQPFKVSLTLNSQYHLRYQTKVTYGQYTSIQVINYETLINKRQSSVLLLWRSTSSSTAVRFDQTFYVNSLNVNGKFKDGQKFQYLWYFKNVSIRGSLLSLCSSAAALLLLCRPTKSLPSKVG